MIASQPRVNDFEFSFRMRGEEQGNAVAAAQRITFGGEDYVFVVMQNVTARKRAERALKESDERFRQLADTIEEVFWLNEVETGRIVYVSPAYEHIWGRSCEALYANSRDWIDAIHPDDRERVYQAFRTKQATGGYDEEYRIVRPDGAVRWIRDRGFPVRDRVGPRVPRRRFGAGRHEPPRARGAAPPDAEDGVDRPLGRRRRARLQQPAHRHPGQLRRACGR